MIAAKSRFIASACLIIAVYATNEASSAQATSQAALKAMEKVFLRSEKAHSTSMATIMKGMSTTDAWTVLEKGNLTTPALLQMTSVLRDTKKNLRQNLVATTTKPQKGYDGISGARKLLNTMIYESMMNYDAEIARCTEFYASQCGALEVCRGQISQSNYVAANARTLILDAQACINRFEKEIPERVEDRTEHVENCEEEEKKMRERLAVVTGDLNVMTKILELTDCEATTTTLPGGSSSTFTQMNVLRCQNCHSRKSFITFDHDVLKHEVANLRSPLAQKLMQETFADMFEGVKAMQSLEFLQLGATTTTTDPYKDSRAETVKKVNGTSQFLNPPLPRTEKPVDPCTDYAEAGRPTVTDKAKGLNKCSISKSPQCYKLQERFLLIQSGIRDEEGALKLDILKHETMCNDTTKSLTEQIEADEKTKEQCEVKLSFAIEKEATAGEEARQTERQHGLLTKELKDQMDSCSKNYIQFESEMCALKKIRGEVYKIKGGGHSAFFQDCEVSEWEADQCSAPCKRHDDPTPPTQHLSRNVLVHSDDGAKCLPLAAIRKCNFQPCPVDCKLADWHGWSKCSAECGGGEQTRQRDVKVAAAYGGKPCGAESETRQCNSQACEEDCTLSEWGAWSHCSKDCDGGTRKRSKRIAAAPRGTGKCPGAWDPTRLEYKSCNMFSCVEPGHGTCNIYHKDPNEFFTCDTLPLCCHGYEGAGTAADKVQCLPHERIGVMDTKYEKEREKYGKAWTQANNYNTRCGAQPMPCNKELDIVFLLDGSGSLGQAGWDAEIKAAKTFVSAFSRGGAKANMALILYSGPRTWSGVYKCIGKSVNGVNMKEDCKIDTVDHFTSDMAKITDDISKLKWPKGSTLTSLALMKAKAELNLGRKDAKSVVVVITDGRPLSYRSTKLASEAVRKVARLVWVPVTQFAPLSKIKEWATRRWEENVVRVKTFEELNEPIHVVNHVIASICPLE